MVRTNYLKEDFFITQGEKFKGFCKKQKVRHVESVGQRKKCESLRGVAPKKYRLGALYH